METRVEEIAGDKVRLSVDVPRVDVQHAVEHAASDLAESLKIPGFRKGKVPMPVLVARVGKDRIFAEAVESHIGGWYRAAVAGSRIRPASTPEYDYTLPESSDTDFSFTATVDVQPKIEIADWTTLEVPVHSAEVPPELVDRELEALRNAVAELAPVEGRPAAPGDVVVVDLVSESGETRRDVVVELGGGRLVDELEQGLTGMSAGETKDITFEVGEEGETQTVTATVKELKEKVLPPLDDELAKAATEFDTLAELRADLESRLREQLDEEIETEFRAAAVDALVDASKVTPAEGLVQARANTLLANLVQSLERRGVSVEAYLAVSGSDARGGHRARDRRGDPVARARARARGRRRQARARGDGRRARAVRPRAGDVRGRGGRRRPRRGGDGGRARGAVPRRHPPAQGARPHRLRGDAYPRRPRGSA